jgi:hypothetical protein
MPNMLPIPADFPDVNEAAKTLQTVIYQNHHDLRDIAEDAMGQIGSVIDANNVDQARIQKQITSQLAGKISANARDCKAIADFIADNHDLICNPGPIVPPVATGGGTDGECNAGSPVCASPDSVFWCLHFFSGPSEYWQVFCETPDMIGLVAERLNAQILGSWLTYDEAVQCCCSHATNCPSFSGPPAR